jgi:predicted O-methyltransferase YrrM
VTSLRTAPVADVIEQLYRAAAEAHGHAREDRPSTDPAPTPGTWSDDQDYYARTRHLYMAVSPRTGTLLYLLARNRRAATVVEFGTSFGLSILHLGAAVKDNGGGRVIGTEFEPGKVEATRGSVRAAGLGDIVEVRQGDATQTLGRDLPDRVDLLFLDGAKSLYLDVLALVEPHLAPGALVVADNASRAEGYLDHVRSSPAYLSADVGGDVEVSMSA